MPSYVSFLLLRFWHKLLAATKNLDNSLRSPSLSIYLFIHAQLPPGHPWINADNMHMHGHVFPYAKD